MGYFRLRNLVCYLFALALPALTLAGTQTLCKCGPPTSESNKWNFSKEASGLLAQMHTDAYRVQDTAARLESFGGERQMIDWRVDAGMLARTRIRVNNMDRILCRLRTIQRVLPADQQAEIKALAPAVVEVTDNTQHAIQFLDHHRDDLFLPQYEAYAQDIFNEASRADEDTAGSVQNVTPSSTGSHNAASQNLKAGS